MSALSYAQDRWESPEEVADDDLADAIEQAIAELIECRNTLLLAGWGKDRREAVADSVRHIGGYLVEVQA